MKKIVDISWPISPAMTAYKDRKIVSFTERKSVQKDGAAETTLVLDAHSGTHVDAPSHFISGGNTIDATPLSSLLGECLVIDCVGQQSITADFLRDFEIEPHMIVLFKTDNSTQSITDLFNPLFVYVDAWWSYRNPWYWYYWNPEQQSYAFDTSTYVLPDQTAQEDDSNEWLVMNSTGQDINAISGDTTIRIAPGSSRLITKSINNRIRITTDSASNLFEVEPDDIQLTVITTDNQLEIETD